MQSFARRPFARGRIPTLLAIVAAGCVPPAGIAVPAPIATVDTTISPAPGTPRIGSAVEVSFAMPTDVAVVRNRRRGDVRWADTTRLRGAHSISGRVTAVRGDTLRIAVRDARTATGRTTIRNRPIATVAPAAGVEIGVINRKPGLANGVVLSVIGTLLGAYLFLALTWNE